MAVTTQLLDALLSPSGATGGGQHSPRAQAEQHLSSLSLPDRVAGLLNLLLTTASNAASSSSSDPTDQSRAMLCAVLLRRDITSLGGNAHSATGVDHPTAMRMLREMASPLLQLFLGDGGSSNKTSKTTRRQVGHCLAELCLSCSVLASTVDGNGDGAANEVMAQVLTGIGPGVSFSFHLSCTAHEMALIDLFGDGCNYGHLLHACLLLIPVEYIHTWCIGICGTHFVLFAPCKFMLDLHVSIGRNQLKSTHFLHMPSHSICCFHTQLDVCIHCNIHQ